MTEDLHDYSALVDRWLSDQNHRLIDRIRAGLDIESGLGAAVTPSVDSELTTDISGALDIESGLSAILKTPPSLKSTRQATAEDSTKAALQGGAKLRVGAVHLGWDVVSVAAGGGGTPIRPVRVEGTYTPPAYLLADSSGRLHSPGAERQRPDLSIAISDVRDVLGHHQIRTAGATWPLELVFRARLYDPLAAVGKYLRGKPDLVALPYPDDWPDEKVDDYCHLVELLDITAEPLPESVALSGYVHMLRLVHPPEPRRPAPGATGVYSDGRVCLVVAVHTDDEQPTKSVSVPIAPDAMRDAHSAVNLVIEVMAAAHSIGANTSTVLLTGNVCFNDALRLAFQSHLGHRLHIADHPMHALVLGAAHLVATTKLETNETTADPVQRPRWAQIDGKSH